MKVPLHIIMLQCHYIICIYIFQVLLVEISTQNSFMSMKDYVVGLLSC